MYDWLSNAVDADSQVVTPNRRLARTLTEAYGQQQLSAGEIVWRTPRIAAWDDWLAGLLTDASHTTQAPLRLNTQQSQLLWEEALRANVDGGTTHIAALARVARSTWQRLQESQVDIQTVARSATNDDHRLFASVAGRYLGELQRNTWIDEAQVGAEVLAAIERHAIQLPKRIVLVGFDLETALLASIATAIESSGVDVVRVPRSERRESASSASFENPDGELRAAGAWARGILERLPTAKVAIVKQGLERTAQRDVRLLREGFAPGWQYGPDTLRVSVNVSYGQRLSDYPAISIGLLVLRWLYEDLGARDVASLLLTDHLGGDELAERSRRELRLRDLPDRQWSPAMIAAALRSDADCAWLQRIARFARWRRGLPQRQSPADWAVAFSEILEELGWCSGTVQDSDAFQLTNRWRELLNEFARLDLVAGPIPLQTAVRRLQAMASDVIYQPESPHAAVQLLGPLEAAGAEYDAMWIAGMTSHEWPGPGTPSPLVSRALQQAHGMPDASPADTLAVSQALFDRLAQSSQELVCSWSEQVGDSDESPSELLLQEDFDVAEHLADPGWNALRLSDITTLAARDDQVPEVSDEQIFGGASTVARQLDEPFQAFATGRLGITPLYRQAVGIPASLRGNVIHDALYRIYQQVTDRQALLTWDSEEVVQRSAQAVGAAMSRHERNTDKTLLQLLRIERTRLTDLIARFIELDRARDDFTVVAVEEAREFQRGPVKLTLRFDRVDSFGDGSLAIFDYKTGSAKQLANRRGEVYDPQLFVYALAMERDTSAVALVNIDNREISWSGAGRDFGNEDLWDSMVETVNAQIELACAELARGDVRVRLQAYGKRDRTLNLLSRSSELRDE